jgi:tetratricopeptide (TPR) repeat protein
MQKQIEIIEDLTRARQFTKAREYFSELNRSELNRSLFAPYASLAWRLGDADAGLRLLSSLMKYHPSLRVSVSEREVAEYANCLTYVGCTQEALALLGQSNDSWALQAKAFAHIAQWEYQEAHEQLTQILPTNQLPEYSLLVCKVNLAACLVFMERWSEAQTLIENLFLSKSGHMGSRLAINLKGLLLQISVMSKDWSEANQIIRELELSEFGTPDLFVIEKWKAIASARQDYTNTMELFQVRTKALAQGRWETVRDCDYHIATITKNTIFFHRVYFATPYQSFREKITKNFNSASSLPESFDYWIMPKELEPTLKSAPNLEINLSRGEIGDVQMKVGQSEHSTLIQFTHDLYKPLSIGSLFYGLYPTEKFDPFTSPNRIHQCIKALRSFFDRNQIPIGIIEENGRYSLNPLVPISVQLPKAIEAKHQYQARLELIQEALGSEFTKSQVIQHLNCSPKTAQRILSDAVERGFCVKFGHGKRLKYVRKT